MKTNWKEFVGGITLLLIGFFSTWLVVYGIIKEKSFDGILFYGIMGTFCLIAGTLWFVFTNDFFVAYYEESVENYRKVVFKNKYLLVNMQTNMAYELPLEFINKNLKYVKIKLCYDIKQKFRMEEFNIYDQVFKESKYENNIERM